MVQGTCVVVRTLRPFQLESVSYKVYDLLEQQRGSRLNLSRPCRDLQIPFYPSVARILWLRRYSESPLAYHDQ